jgi:hypothetical protein
MMAKLVGSFVRPLRRISQLERNREPRWRHTVPSGWALELDKPTFTHRCVDFFYHRLQYFRADEPGRQKAVEQYRSGYVTPAEEAYGERYQVLPAQRETLAAQRGAPRRPELVPPATAPDTPPGR